MNQPIVNFWEKPIVGNSLLLAGIVPVWLTPANIQMIYYTLLIPPAAFHLYCWIKNSIWPTLKRSKDKEQK